jgi:hypothetical protein
MLVDTSYLSLALVFSLSQISEVDHEGQSGTLPGLQKARRLTQILNRDVLEAVPIRARSAYMFAKRRRAGKAASISLMTS